MKHSAEWYRGALEALDNQRHYSVANLRTHYRQQLAEAEAREAGEREAAGVGDLFNAIAYCEGGGYDQGDVSEALYKAYALGANSLADQLAAAQAEVERLSTRVDALEDSMNPQDVATVDATLREKAEQLAAAQAEARGLRLLADLWKNNAQKYREWVGRALDKQKEYLDLAQYFSGEDPARDARMKALGAAEVWEIVAERSKLVGDSAGEQYARAEAARLAEGE